MRLALLHRILDVIDKSRGFKPQDFEITHKITSGAHAFTIAHRAFPAYCLTATVVRGKIQGSVSPGELAETEHFTADGRDEFLAVVRAWLDWTHQELLARPLVRQLEEQGNRIEVLCEQWERLPDEYFSRGEAAELTERLDSLHGEIAQRLAKLGMEDGKLRARMKDIEADVAFLKSTAQLLKKPHWALALARRCVGWIGDANNRAMVKDVTDIARKLLGPGHQV
jgi:hypothetical protein